ncbi:MAG TPA: GAF domain-containing protein [Rhizomicrobium sp.]|nr:GAF domain-containing protein [Rhizomicrobium sp.]
MFEAATISTTDPLEFHAELARQAKGLLAGERDWIANAANLAALIFTTLPDLNWAGFYILKGDTLVLGPFQGKPACVRIAKGRGVCGAAAELLRTLRVDDVNDFPDHIACDTASRSELVVPLIRDGAVLGVLDLDSPRRGRFSAIDQAGVERLAAIFVGASDLP